MRLTRAFVVVATIAGTAGCGHEDVNTTLTRVSRAREVVADLTVQFTMASDAANRSVMADTDEASVEFAKESRASAAAVQQDITRLRETLTTLAYQPEDALLTEFANNFVEYQKLDDSILGLAVENTNLKAQRLAFGPAQDAANEFRDALHAITPANSGDAWRVEALVATALLTVREIQVLQAPHIANADEAVMTKMEQQMSTSQTAARKSLDELRSVSAPSSRAAIGKAASALNRFFELNTQLIALSRRNSNVRSLMLSLDEKRRLTVTCQENLRALQEALAKRGYSGIREH